MNGAHRVGGRMTRRTRLVGLRERFPELIQDFRAIAKNLLGKLPAPSLACDDLVNEAYLKLVREEARRLHANRSGLGGKPPAALKACFGAACRDVMSLRWRRRVRRRETRVLPDSDGDRLSQYDLADIHEMLSVLATCKPEICEIAEARIFGELTVRECAELFGVSPKTVDRRWALARAWLRRELGGEERPEVGSTAAVRDRRRGPGAVRRMP